MCQIRILYLITSTNIGGTERALYNLLGKINREKYRVQVCSVKRPGGFAERIASRSDSFHTLGLPEAGGMRAACNFIPALARLFILIRRFRPHIIHSFLFRANLLGRLAGRAAGVPVVISSVRVIEDRAPLKHVTERLTSFLVDRYTSVTEAARRFTIEHAGIEPDKIITVYNGIDVEAFASRSGSGPELDPQCRHIALVGRFDIQKGHAIVLKAMEVLVKKVPVTLHLFGEGPLEAALREQVRRAGLDGQVRFRGTVEDIAGWLARMDAVVLPSLWEGFPNAALEAMALERPVVAARIAGLDEVVLDGESGMLCAPGDPAALADALARLLQDRDFAQRMGRNGLRRVRERFSLEHTARATEKLYADLLNTV